MELTPEITQARTAAQTAGATAGQSGSEQYKVEDVLRQKIIDAYNSSQDIIKPLDQATMNYLGAPAEARVKYQNVFNPFQRENLVSEYQGTTTLPMLSLSSMLGQRFGRIEDTIGAGVRGFQAQATADQAKAKLAQDLYDSLLGEYSTGQQLAGQESDRQLAREKFEWDKTHPSSSGDGGGLTPEMLKLLFGGGSTTNLEEPPEPSPINQSAQREWPVGSGVWWMGDGKGGWE